MQGRRYPLATKWITKKLKGNNLNRYSVAMERSRGAILAQKHNNIAEPVPSEARNLSILQIHRELIGRGVCTLTRARSFVIVPILRRKRVGKTLLNFISV